MRGSGRGRGRGRTIATALTDALHDRAAARPVALATAFAEACGWPLSREVALRGSTRTGCLIVVATTRAWADQVERLAPIIVARVAARLGPAAATSLDVRVGAAER